MAMKRSTRRTSSNIPSVPDVPDIPDTPDVPDVPEVFSLPLHRRTFARARFMPRIVEVANADTILTLAGKHLGEPYILGARAPMANSSWRGPWDCAEFVSWCVYQATGILFGTEPRHDPIKADAFTGFWADQANEAGAVISVEEAARIPGACVLRVPRSGRVGHIVFSDGKGGTIEAHSAATGVKTHTLSDRRWDYGILVPGVRYFTAEKSVKLKPPGDVLRYTEPMMRGKSIERLQKCLNKLGYAAGDEDGVFGPQTEAAVQLFQADNELLPDGEAGDITLAALEKRCKAK